MIKQSKKLFSKETPEGFLDSDQTHRTGLSDWATAPQDEGARSERDGRKGDESHYMAARNSSMVKFAERTKLRSVPLATSL